MSAYKRIFLTVCDGFGVGNASDAALYGDSGSNTLKSVYSNGAKLPTFKKLGLFNIDGVNFAEKEAYPIASYGAMRERSRGKDTTTGHWEMTGAILNEPFDVFEKGFPKEFIREFEEVADVKTLCNKPYSGTKVIEDYGEEHLRTGKLIVYTSADSVFQIAAHGDKVSVNKLYEYCNIARELLDKRYRVGRVIARPFTGEKGNFVRTSQRHDFSMRPPYNILNALKDNGYSVIGVGKIYDIFAGEGLSETLGVNKDNFDGMQKSSALLKRDFTGLCFINLVDGDTLYGHRRDVKGYIRCMEEIDSWLSSFIEDMREDDLLLITGDHGCDPSFKGSDHTRENVPILAYSKGGKNVNLGLRDTFADISATVAENFSLKNINGESFLNLL